MSIDSREHSRKAYNNAASYYDVIEFIRKGTRTKVIKFSGWQPGQTVLDLCTGTGDLALAFASAGAHVVGVDIAIKMLEQAAGKAAHRRLSWAEMDATHLDYKDNTFDIVTISLALHHMPEPLQLDVLREAARVARYKIVIVEPHQPFNKRLHLAWGLVASVVDKSKFMRHWVRQDFSRTCEKAGLTIEKIFVMTWAIHRVTVCRPPEH